MEDNNILDTEITPSFGKEIAKSLIISTAVTAGTVVGFIAVGFAIDKIQKIKAERAAKKAQTEE